MSCPIVETKTTIVSALIPSLLQLWVNRGGSLSDLKQRDLVLSLLVSLPTPHCCHSNPTTPSVRHTHSHTLVLFENDTRYKCFVTLLPPASLSPSPSSGLEFVVPKSGYFCNLCSVFYLNESTAKDVHCSSQRHFDNLQVHKNTCTKFNHTKTHTGPHDVCVSPTSLLFFFPETLSETWTETTKKFNSKFSRLRFWLIPTSSTEFFF